jgi:hypothetical protein
MDPANLIPYAEALPAPWWILEFLGMLTLMLHLLAINIVLGGSLLALFSRLKGDNSTSSLTGVFAGKVPSTIAIAVTLGVAPLLFVQVLYGHFFYTSSVLMARYWIAVIPAVIIAYYAAYVTARKHGKTKALATGSLAVTCLALLYVAFTFQNNISLMLQPAEWSRYFANRGGTLLNVGDKVLWPRYLHFITASFAVAGLFSAVVWDFRRKKNVEGSQGKIDGGMRIFAIATMIQVVLGFWLLISLPKDVMMHYMGQNMVDTVSLMLAIVLAVAVIMTAVLKRLWTTVWLTVLTVAVMIVMRTTLRNAYIEPYFNITDVPVHTHQYPVFALFLVTFVVGLVVVYKMVRWAMAGGKEAAR